LIVQIIWLNFAAVPGRERQEMLNEYSPGKGAIMWHEVVQIKARRIVRRPCEGKLGGGFV